MGLWKRPTRESKGIQSGSCPRIAQRSWAFRRRGPADPAVRPALHLGAHAVSPAQEIPCILTTDIGHEGIMLNPTRTWQTDFPLVARGRGRVLVVTSLYLQRARTVAWAIEARIRARPGHRGGSHGREVSICRH